MLRPNTTQTSGARLDTSNVRGRMTFSLSLLRKLYPTLGGEGERAQRTSCVGTDRAERAPYPRVVDEVTDWAKRADQRRGGALIPSRAAKRRASLVAMRPSLERGVTP